MFTLAVQAGKLLHRPHIPMLQEDNVRTGFFEREQLDALLPHLPAPIQPVVRFAYVTGWRVASEILPLQWRQIDFPAGEIRLDPGTTKNREGRVFKMTAELRALLEAQKALAGRLQREEQEICPWVFHRRRKAHQEPHKGVESGVYGGWLSRAHPARSSPDRGSQHGLRWRA